MTAVTKEAVALAPMAEQEQILAEFELTTFGDRRNRRDNSSQPPARYTPPAVHTSKSFHWSIMNERSLTQKIRFLILLLAEVCTSLSCKLHCLRQLLSVSWR